MSQSPEPESKGWWQTLPGLLTAGAGIITALTGLLLALHQAGLLGRSPKPAEPDRKPPSSTSTGSTPTSASGTAGAHQIQLPASSQVRSGDTVYQLLSAQVEPYAPGKVALRLTVRMTNNSGFPANFWAASFRVVADGATVAPTSDLDRLVAAHATGDATLEFVLPDSTSTVGLQIGEVGEGKPTLPLSLH